MTENKWTLVKKFDPATTFSLSFTALQAAVGGGAKRCKAPLDGKECGQLLKLEKPPGGGCVYSCPNGHVQQYGGLCQPQVTKLMHSDFEVIEFAEQEFDELIEWIRNLLATLSPEPGGDE